MAHQVQHGAFGRQQAAGRRLDRQDRRTGVQPGTVLDAVDHAVTVGAEDLVEHQQRDVDTGGHARLPIHHRGGRHGIGGHGGTSRDVRAIAQVFFERTRDRGSGLGQLSIRKCHQHTAVAVSRTGRPLRRELSRNALSGVGIGVVGAVVAATAFGAGQGRDGDCACGRGESRVLEALAIGGLHRARIGQNSVEPPQALGVADH